MILPDEPTRPLILHVTEAMGGGLEDALDDFVRSAPAFRHALLFTRRGGFATAEARPDGVLEVIDAGRGVRALHRAYRVAVTRLQPDVIHLHSAWAGLIGRLADRSLRRAPIVYSPHSWYFDRRDAVLPVRWLARAVERLLLLRTDLVAAVSPDEASTARRMGAVVQHVPNVVRLPEGLRWRPHGGTPEVVVVGRVAEQKDPAFLLRVVAIVRQQAPDVRWTWIGAGDERLERRLRRGGVVVTGWMPRADCLQRMTAASVYLHTAGWEGSPITLLEAAATGMPIVARSIDSLDSLGFDPALRSAEAVAAALLRQLRGEGAPTAGSPATPADQSRAIETAYRTALAQAPARVRRRRLA